MKDYKEFTFKLKLKVAQTWIDDGVTSVNLKERLKEYIEEELNPYAYEGEYIVEIK